MKVNFTEFAGTNNGFSILNLPFKLVRKLEFLISKGTDSNILGSRKASDFSP